jgi:hypothetical protein
MSGMSKQLAISAAISVMIMAIFVLYGPGLAQHVGALPDSGVLPELSGLKALLAN